MWTLNARPTALLISLVSPVWWLALACQSPTASQPEPSARAPSWSQTGGQSPRYPNSVYVTGFAMAVGDRSLERAKAEAAADLAGRISVRIEHELRDVSAEKDGVYSYQVASTTRATADVKLSGLAYETHRAPEREGERVYALAVLERAPAAAERRSQRDRSLAAAQACLASAARHVEEGRESDAVETLETCRLPTTEALEHDAVGRALHPGDDTTRTRDAAALAELVAASRAIDDGIRATLRRPTSNMREAVEGLAMQLERQGVAGRGPMTVSPFTYGTADLSSTFGREIARDLEGAMVRRANLRTESTTSAHRIVRGVYVERGEDVHLSVTVKGLEKGRLLASAATTLPRSVIPHQLELRPSNFNAALVDQKLLAEGELLSGGLRVEIWTDRGKRGVLYNEDEELKLFMKTNRPAWVRLVYVLQSGVQVPIDQGYYIDASKVNFVVEYPESFEVVPPFGVEHVHATAFSEEPAPLATRFTKIDGVEYEVVADGLKQNLERTRGLRRKHKAAISEAFVTLTTTPADPFAR